MADFLERFGTLCTLLGFQFKICSIFVFFVVISLFEKKIAILCSQVTLQLVTGEFCFCAQFFSRYKEI